VNCPHCQALIADGARFCGACGRATLPTTSTPPPAPADSAVEWVGREIVGRYRIKSKLGEGGMGAVFKAEQISLKRVVALKLLKPELVNSPMLLRRFNAEAEAVAKLNHPNTVGIYDFGQDRDGTLFIAMELVEGRSLRAALIADSPLAAMRALHIGAQIAASLSDAHALGIIHRDLKPDNIMLQDRGKSRDIVRVLDFGIAKLRDDSRMTQQSMTQAGDVLGTPQYMSPEQIRGEEIDGRADVYSLGAILYEMLTGRMVFEATSLVAMLSKHLLDQPEAPSRRRPDLGISAEIDELVLSCLAKDPRARLPSMEQLGERVIAIAPALAGMSSSGDLPAHRLASVSSGDAAAAQLQGPVDRAGRGGRARARRQRLSGSAEGSSPRHARATAAEHPRRPGEPLVERQRQQPPWQRQRCR
jgi:eukaryotic-like serine/threonine-protein kinase